MPPSPRRARLGPSAATAATLAFAASGLGSGALPGPAAAEPPGAEARSTAQRGAQARGRIDCRVTENGVAASGTVRLRQSGREVASGACGTPLAAPAGRYEAVLELDGALDRPTQTVEVTIAAGSTATASADFRTGILEIAVEQDGRRAAGMATIFRNGERIGTLGSGVAGHLSVGTYDVVVRYRTSERRFEGVTLGPGERRVLSAAF
jgi:hypothetical protein